MTLSVHWFLGGQTSQTLLIFWCYVYAMLKITLIKLLFVYVYAAAAKLLQLWQTLWDPRDGSPPGSPVPGILQIRTLEWRKKKKKNTGVGCHVLLQSVKVKSLSRVWLLATLWTAAYQAPLSMGFSRQEYWSGLPLPSPGYVYTICIYVVLSCSGVSDSFDLKDCSLPGSSVHGISQQEYWTGLPFPPPGDPPDSEPGAPIL